MDDKQLDGLERGSDAAQLETARADARRRFIKGAALASPVLLSIASRPVLGTSRFCSASGFMSGNLSNQGGKDVSCGGNSPGYWKNHTSPGAPWPTPYLSGRRASGATGISYTGGTQFHSVFKKSGGFNYGTKTLLQVLWEHPGSLAFHAIAALLNAKAGIGNYVLTDLQVRQIWDGIVTNGVYTTTTGHKMYEADAKAFFEQTYH